MATSTETARPQQERARRPVRRPRMSVALIVLTVAISIAAIAEICRTSITLAQAYRDYPDTLEFAGAEDEAAEEAFRRVSFCAVGDNLINGAGDYTVDLLGLGDAWAGEVGDGAYDFSPLYERISPKIQGYDIAFVNQETVLGGNDFFEYQGYPSYNTPDEAADALVQAGFDVVNCATNHTYDLWTDAIEHAQRVWAQKEGVSVVGSYADEADRARIRVIERNGVKLAFLAYCYGQNGYTQDELPNDYYAAPIDRDKMAAEVETAREVADGVVVYLHWGQEMEHALTDEQKSIAAFLAGSGVDLVIGSHAHVIQPVTYVTRGIPTTDGSGANAQNGMLCVYGLGDFVSGYTLPGTILSGMFTCDFVLDDTGRLTIENPVWHALIEHSEQDIDAVYELSEYSEELAQRNVLLARVAEEGEYATEGLLAWARNATSEAVGDAIPIEM